MSLLTIEDASVETTANGAADTQFHVTLCVADLAKSVRFYACLLGRQTAMQQGNYARFELESPALVVVLYATSRPPGGTMNHVGLRLTSAEQLVEVQRRMEMEGFATQRQDGVECCYAKQTKFWATDPDGVMWELYILEEDIDHSGFDDMPAARPASSANSVWNHRLTDPLPGRIFCLDGSVDEVRLEGTFNLPLDGARRAALLAEVQRVLRPGGKVVVHALVADRPFPGKPQLPGMAAVVQHVPVEFEIQSALQAAGFEGVFYETLSDVNCLSQAGLELRQCLAAGYKPLPAGGCADQFVLYRGPLAQVRDDQGNGYRRGERVAVTAAVAQRLQTGPAADQFAFLASTSELSLPMAGGCCNC